MKPNLETSRNHSIIIRRRWSPLISALATAAFSVSFCAQALIVGPYSRDTDTLHLWHANESTAPVLDSAVGGTNLATLGGGALVGANSFSGFGTALNTLAGTGAYLAGRPLVNGVGDEIQMSYADPTTGAYTIEAIVRVDFNPATYFRGNVPLYLITGENDATGSRPWQFRIHNNNVSGGPFRLEFFNTGGSGSVIANLPTTGDDAIVQGNWFHVAVTFDGAAAGGNIKLYWTLMNDSRVQANLIGTGTLGNLNPMAAASLDFCIGNVGRTTANGNWVGLIDEVRMSKVARSATDMMFNTVNPCVSVAINTQPAPQTAEVRQPATLNVVAYGTEPMSYQWRLNGTPIAGATQSAYTIASALPADGGNYDVIVTNSCPSSVTSEQAHLTVQYFPVSIVTQPVPDTVAFGQPASFSVGATGTAPLAYQWLRNSLPIAGATNSTYTIAAAQGADAGTYTVTVTNEAPSSMTSDPVSLTVRNPINLTWLGSSDYPWDTTSAFWDSNGDLTPDAAYTEGDNARFDDNGVPDSFGYCSLNLDILVHPNSVVVSNTVLPYEIKGVGAITRNGGLRKQGSGSLALGIDNAFTGPTIIEEGTMMVGLGGNSTRGSLGSGPITNQALLLFHRTGTLTMSNAIAGSGELIKTNTLSLRLLGSNTMSGPIKIKSGSLAVGPAGLGNSTSITLDGAGGGDGTALILTTDALGRGTVVGSGVTINSNPADDSNRTGILNEAGTNIINAAIVMSGAGVMPVRTVAGALEINGPISGPNFINNYISFRGTGTNNFLRSHINLPEGGIQKDDAGTWLITASGNSFKKLRMLGAVAGTLKLAVDNALGTGAYIETDGGTLDLAGFNQTVIGLTNDLVGQIGTTVANSSTTSDSRLSIINSLPNTWGPSGCIIANSTAGGTRKVSLTVAIGGIQILTNVCTHSGDTTINAGTLALTNKATLANSTPIVIAAGATLDVSARTNGTLTLGAAQEIKGNGSVIGILAVQGTLAPGASVGTLTVSGNVSFSGTAKTVMEVDNSAATKDLLQVGGTLAYGGTLTITNISAVPYAPNQVIKLFNATGGYSGSFASINFPGVAAYDASNLTVDGTIKVVTLVSTVPVNVAAAVATGNKLNLSWPADHTTWRLLAQTNAPGVGLSANWFYVPGSASTNQMFLPLDPTIGSVFYRLVYP